MYHYLFNKLSDGKHLLSLFVEENTGNAEGMIHELNQLSKREKLEAQKWKPHHHRPQYPWTKREVESVAVYGTEVWANFFGISENGIYVRYIPLCFPILVYPPNFTDGETEAPVGGRSLMEVSFSGCPMSLLFRDCGRRHKARVMSQCLVSAIILGLQHSAQFGWNITDCQMSFYF